MSLATRFIGRAWLWLSGFRYEAAEPLPARCVLIAAPHTSNWDLPFALAAAFVGELPMRWLAKHSIFRPPFGWFFRAMGGIPVDRREPHHLVSWLANLMRETPEIVLAIPPKGTRGRREYWKSGFYHVALSADVPVCLGFLDYGRKVVGLGPCLRMTGDVRADMDRIRSFYKDMRGLKPELEAEPRLREEGAAETLPPPA